MREGDNESRITSSYILIPPCTTASTVPLRAIVRGFVFLPEERILRLGNVQITKLIYQF